MRSGSFHVRDRQSLAALTLARTLGITSRLWKQRGLGTIYQAIGRLPILGNLRCQAEVEDGVYFETPIFEPYWGPTVVGRRPYEVELRFLLRELRGLDATFLDGGANYGYWSVVACSNAMGCKRVVAIEANPSTFELLRRNAALNADRFVCVQYAVSDCDGQVVNLAAADSHLIAYIDNDAKTGVSVETITLDTVMKRLGWDNDCPVIVKLDVEGHELKALDGAKELCARADHVVVVEDFARIGFPTARALRERGYVLSYVCLDGRCRRLKSENDAGRWIAEDGKPQRFTNFIASKPGGEIDRRMEAWSRRF